MAVPWKPQPVVDSKMNGNAMTAMRAAHIFNFTMNLLMNSCAVAVPRTRVVDDKGRIHSKRRAAAESTQTTNVDARWTRL